MSNPLTPPASLRSPIEISSRSSSLSTLINPDSPTSIHSLPSPDKTNASTGPLTALQVYDRLLSDLPPNSGLSIPIVLALGGQNAGKSSFLSAVGGFDLYCEAGTATRGPTFIHSRRRLDHSFQARIQIRLSHPGKDVPQRFLFTTQTFTSPDELVHALLWAGDEARSNIDGVGGMRTYDQLKKMSPEQRLANAGSWSPFTENLVILRISGPNLIDLSIIDLPGLVGNQHADFVTKLAEGYIRSPSNIILLCLNGGDEPQLNRPEVQLVRRHDPDGQRTIGLFTKADKIEITEEDTATKIILGKDDVKEWRLNHGWWPFRGKTVKEREKGMSEAEYRLKQRELFSDDDWMKIQKQTGRAFGVEALRAKLVGMVADAQTPLQNAINASTDQLKAYPPPIDLPVRELHSLILEIASTLRAKISDENKFTTALVDLQLKLHQDLTRTLPQFAPYRENDMENSELYSEPEIPGWPGSDKMSDEVVYVNEVFAKIAYHTHRRNGSANYHKVREYYIAKYARAWADICKGHVQAVGRLMAEAIEETLQEVCDQRPELLSFGRRVLDDLYRNEQTITLDRISWLSEREQEDPLDIDIIRPITTGLILNWKQAYEQGLNNIYGGTSQATGGPCCGESPDNTDLASKPKEWCVEHRTRVCQIMAQMTVFLVDGSRRLADLVGREVQFKAVKYLDGVVGALQVGLGLDEVIIRLEKRARSMVEPDADIVQQREECQKKLKTFEELGRLLGV